MAGLTGEAFVGYTFRGPPPRRPRLWFLDRHLKALNSHRGWIVKDDPTRLELKGLNIWKMTDARTGADLGGLCAINLTDVAVRYDHSGEWRMLWRLTDITIGHIVTFGRDDDVWRLGVWPD